MLTVRLLIHCIYYKSNEMQLVYNSILLMNKTDKTFTLPKIKKVQLMNRVMIDPADIKKGLPTSTLPQLSDQGIILTLKPHKAPLAKLTPDGTLKMSLKYTAEVVHLLGRYVEVKVIDDYDQFWIGNLFGINVRGKGGSGDVRGCKVTAINAQKIMVEAVSKGKNELWSKLQNKIQEILSNAQ